VRQERQRGDGGSARAGNCGRRYLENETVVIALAAALRGEHGFVRNTTIYALRHV
jgi:hypothetical protein